MNEGSAGGPAKTMQIGRKGRQPNALDPKKDLGSQVNKSLGMVNSCQLHWFVKAV